MPQITRFKESTQHGFALVIALSLMAFILLLLLSITSLVSVESQSSQIQQSTLSARQNAQLSLMLAVGELQKYAGKDQRVTARADITAPDPKNKFWTGIWDASNTSAAPAWIVSGNQGRATNDPNYLTPATNLPDPDGQNNTVWLVENSVSDPADQVKVQTDSITGINGNTQGRFAYWVADEGIKAKFNIQSEDNTPSDSQTALPTTLAYQFGIDQIDPIFSDNNFEENAQTGIAHSMEELPLLTNNNSVYPAYFHDLTASSLGLLTDTKNGGFKKDLTFAFEDNSIYQMAFGGNANDPRRFFINNLEDPDGNLTGPNWDILKDYYNLYNEVSDNRINMRLPAPDLYSPIRSEFTPYHKGYDAWNDNDIYHRNNPLNPVISRVQLDFALRTESSDGVYKVYLDVRPSFGLYNPYNIALNDKMYSIYFELNPEVVINVAGTDYTIKFSDRGFMRDNNGFLVFVLNTKRKTDGDGTNNTNFMPGETRIFMSRRLATWMQTDTVNWLQNTYEPNGYLYAQLFDDSFTVEPEDLIQVKSLSIGDEFFVYLLAADNADYNKVWDLRTKAGNKSVQRFRSLWQSGTNLGPATLSEPLPPIEAQYLTERESLCGWSFNLQTTRSNYGLRAGIDSNLRALAGDPKWDGSYIDNGNTMASGFEYQGDHGLSFDAEVPPEVNTGTGRYNGYWGSTIGYNEESEYVTLFDVPREPLLSIGALQHANLSRYNIDPSFVIGNSYANPRIPLNSTLNTNFASVSDLDIYDLPYLVNDKIWDSYFFSSIDPGLNNDDIQELIDKQAYRNKRYLFTETSDNMIAQGVFDKAKNNEEEYNALASYMAINGPFNVNSTSVDAWIALLSSMDNLELPTFLPEDNSAGLDNAKTFFTRLNTPYGSAFKNEDDSTQTNFWRGYHELTENQIIDLAQEIVTQLQARGQPFGTMADFVNRSLQDTVSGTDSEQASGILQHSIDQTINQDITSALANDVGEATGNMTEGSNPYVNKDLEGSQSAGFPGHLLQGDLLQALAPILTTRSDTFIIRSYGDSRDPMTNEPMSTAYCEAVVQRIATPTEGDPNLANNRNDPTGEFGRQFKIVHFRWIQPEDV